MIYIHVDKHTWNKKKPESDKTLSLICRLKKEGKRGAKKGEEERRSGRKFIGGHAAKEGGMQR